jgi:hypothetical protein
MEYEQAAIQRDQIRALKKSWVWQTLILPEIESRCAGLMAEALAPYQDKPGHAEARYRLDEWRKFQAWLDNAEANAAEIARDADPSLGPGDEREEESP